jgi:hypothetical protein
MSSPGEKLLGGELLAGLALTGIARMWAAGKTGNIGLAPPPPHEFLGLAFLYGGLALVAMFGPEPARLAAGVGGLVLLVILLKAAGQVFSALGVNVPADASPSLTQPGSGEQAI